jgi:hypothetical protein
MILSVTNSTLTTAAQKIKKVRYFSVEIYTAGMLPETQYDFYVDGVLSNAFCRPFGKNLGAPLVSGKDGKLLVQYHMSIPYDQQFLTAKVDAEESGYMAKSNMFEFVDPLGNRSQTYYPIRIKVTK